MMLAAPFSFAHSGANSISLRSADRASSNDSRQVQRLADLCKVWGAIKFFHPYLAYKDINWDDALIKAIPRVESASSAGEYKAAVEFMLSFLNDSATAAYQESSDRNGEDPSDKPKAEAQQGPAQPYVKWLDGNVAVIVATDYDQIAAPEKQAAVRNAMAEAAKANSVIFDIRNKSKSGGADFWFLSAFQQAFPTLLDHPLKLSSSRHRMHSGYATQSGQSSGGYFSGFVNQDGAVVQPQGKPGSQKPMVFLINSRTAAITDFLGGLQAAHSATVIQEGTGELSGGADTLMKMSDGVNVAIRTSEILNPDGSVGFHPDVVIPESGKSGSDDAMTQAIAVANGKTIDHTAAATPAPAFAAEKKDDPYPDMAYPSEPYRLLGLFRFWNVINYFYPYKHLFKSPWEDVLNEFIPKFQADQDAQGYALTVAEMVSNIHDTHGFIRSAELNKYFGTNVPAVQVKLVQGKTVVTYVDDSVAGTSGLKPGDVVVSVDGEDVVARCKRLARNIAASTPQAMELRVHQRLLAGAKDTSVKLKVMDRSGNTKEVELPRTITYLNVQRKTPVFGVLPSGFGYMDLARLTIAQVHDAFEAVKGTKALILDMRGYPNGTAWYVAPRLTDKKVVAALFQRPAPESPDPDQSITVKFPQYTEPSGDWRYTGKVVVLINEEAISQAEHTCLFMEAAAHATFIGSPTNGANGDVTNAVLPGAIYVNFSGHDVRHADGRQLQQMGIQPDIRIEPTIQGVAAGKDEVLERAEKFLKDGK